MNYRIIEGKKLGSRNYEIQGYLYTASSSNERCIYLRCTLWRTNGIECSGSGRIDLSSNIFFSKQVHCHTQENYHSDIIALKNQIKLAAQRSTENLRQVFDDVTSGDGAGALVSYKNLRNTMLKRRRLEIPGIPKTPEEFEEMLFQTRFSILFRSMIIQQEGFAAIFWSDIMFESLKESKLVNFDGTFHVVPKLFYQLFTVFIQDGHHAFPAIHVLMSKKSEFLYEEVLRKIVNLIPEFQPQLAVGEYEKAPRNAFRTIYATIEVSGCIFHYTKAIWKRVKKLQLSSTYTKNSNFNKWIRSIMALPMLLKEEITTVYKLLSDVSCLNLNETEVTSLHKLKCHIKREWVNRNDFSVYGSIQKTNNCCEVYHKSLKSIIRVKRPNLWAFMEFLEKNLKKHDLEYQRKKNGLEIGGRSKRMLKTKRRGIAVKQSLRIKNVLLSSTSKKFQIPLVVNNTTTTLIPQIQKKIMMKIRMI